MDYGEQDSSYNRIKTLVNEELKQYFRPEFLNRLDEIIVFRQLTKSEVKEIADIMLKEVFERLAKKDIDLQVRDSHHSPKLTQHKLPELTPRVDMQELGGLLGCR